MTFIEKVQQPRAAQQSPGGGGRAAAPASQRAVASARSLRAGDPRAARARRGADAREEPDAPGLRADERGSGAPQGQAGGGEPAEGGGRGQPEGIPQRRGRRHADAPGAGEESGVAAG